MTQAARSLGYVCHSCKHALRNSNTLQAPSSIRAFSSTPGRSKTLATFTPTASPELDALLSTWRSEVFLPSVLPPHHTRLIYQESKNEILTTPPGVTVTVQTVLPPNAKNATEAGEENIRLQPMNKFDRPNVNKTLEQITNALSETGDAATWDNLIPFLEGMQLARQSVGESFLPRLARKANIQGEGRWNTILMAAAMAKRTNVRLDQRELTRELVLGAHHRAAASGFASSEPAKTVERIVLMLEADDHCGKHHLERVKNIKVQDESSLSYKEQATLRSYTDMRRDPFVVAANLSFASAKAVLRASGKDTDGVVAKTAHQFLAIVDSLDGGVVDYIQQWHKKKQMGTKGQRKTAEWWPQAQALEELSVVHCALGLANKVDMAPTLGKEKNVQVHTTIRRLLDAIAPEIASARSSVKAAPSGQEKNKDRRCFQLLDAVQGTLKKL